jgi:Tat protein translocase TatB subunit
MPSSLGPAEILVVLVVALIVLGPSRLPEAGRQVGKALSELRRWTQDVKSEVNKAFEEETVQRSPTPLATPAPESTPPADPAPPVASPTASAPTAPIESFPSEPAASPLSEAPPVTEPQPVTETVAAGEAPDVGSTQELAVPGTTDAPSPPPNEAPAHDRP